MTVSLVTGSLSFACAAGVDPPASKAPTLIDDDTEMMESVFWKIPRLVVVVVVVEILDDGSSSCKEFKDKCGVFLSALAVVAAE